jgi:hypothetical protein
MVNETSLEHFLNLAFNFIFHDRGVSVRSNVNGCSTRQQGYGMCASTWGMKCNLACKYIRVLVKQLLNFIRYCISIMSCCNTQGLIINICHFIHLYLAPTVSWDRRPCNTTIEFPKGVLNTISF